MASSSFEADRIAALKPVKSDGGKTTDKSSVVVDVGGVVVEAADVVDVGVVPSTAARVTTTARIISARKYQSRSIADGVTAKSFVVSLLSVGPNIEYRIEVWK